MGRFKIRDAMLPTHVLPLPPGSGEDGGRQQEGLTVRHESW
ncbi:hypothetical protein [Raoultella ornithinolytica]|nr:hypothetical protein [Raoultella ornithinolytica]